MKNGVPVFCLHKVEPNDEALFSDNLTVDVSENNKALPEEYRNTFSDTILTRMWTEPYFQCWNVAYPEQQVKAAEEAALWLDKRLFSNASGGTQELWLYSTESCATRNIPK